jgi:hypothetical protein
MSYEKPGLSEFKKFSGNLQPMAKALPIASNLDDSDSSILPNRKFSKLRSPLRDALEDTIKVSLQDDTSKFSEMMLELNEKLPDLNRRAILRKLAILAGRWSVPLDGIGDDKIKAAKRARDHIVHRGHYDEEGEERGNQLWEHVTVVREIVVRFLLAAIGYRGGYISYVGGYHDSQFPAGTKVECA